ncbi:hypothetical protein C8F04DRAFT_1190643 [Mycena alexandri]|uniref:Uncharacterized protein n=1 Tax=Mycena alexandri TaxID=1745969 RepID=A0AAD6SF08_9AGAR|nr:hypothetical protein C8F04DRAFT_1190643 [Mycena alexandri]
MDHILGGDFCWDSKKSEIELRLRGYWTRYKMAAVWIVGLWRAGGSGGGPGYCMSGESGTAFSNAKNITEDRGDFPQDRRGAGAPRKAGGWNGRLNLSTARRLQKKQREVVQKALREVQGRKSGAGSSGSARRERQVLREYPVRSKHPEWQDDMPGPAYKVWRVPSGTHGALESGRNRQEQAVPKESPARHEGTRKAASHGAGIQEPGEQYLSVILGPTTRKGKNWEQESLGGVKGHLGCLLRLDNPNEGAERKNDGGQSGSWEQEALMCNIGKPCDIDPLLIPPLTKVNCVVPPCESKESPIWGLAGQHRHAPTGGGERRAGTQAEIIPKKEGLLVVYNMADFSGEVQI